MECTIFIIIFVILLIDFDLTGSLQQLTAKKQPLLASLIYTENLLFDKVASSVAGCAVKCSGTHNCGLFTVSASPQSPPYVTSQSYRCRGHSSVVRNGAGQAVWPGAEFFLFTPRVSVWLERPCTGNQDCTISGSECFAGKCLCTPGYYYSHTSDSCLQTPCSKDEQVETYLHYPESRLTGNNAECIYENSTLPECALYCRGLNNCLSFELWASGTCCMNTISPLESPSDWDTNATNADYYTMTCL